MEQKLQWKVEKVLQQMVSQEASKPQYYCQKDKFFMFRFDWKTCSCTTRDSERRERKKEKHLSPHKKPLVTRWSFILSWYLYQRGGKPQERGGIKEKKTDKETKRETGRQIESEVESEACGSGASETNLEFGKDTRSSVSVVVQARVTGWDFRSINEPCLWCSVGSLKKN